MDNDAYKTVGSYDSFRKAGGGTTQDAFHNPTEMEGGWSKHLLIRKVSGGYRLYWEERINGRPDFASIASEVFGTPEKAKTFALQKFGTRADME